MNPSRTSITEEFLHRISHEGLLSKASARLKPLEAYEPLPKMSTWSLICEEVVDIGHYSEHYERVLAELMRRGLSAAEIEKMRVFAWRTAGWLNFDKLVWDWCGLDESVILRAIDWQRREEKISASEAEQMELYVAQYKTMPPPANQPALPPTPPSQSG